MKFSYGFTILFLLLASVNSHEDHREKRQAAITLRKWAQNTVYHYLDGLSTHQNDVVNRVISKFQLSTCINFVVNATARNRIKIYSDPAVNGCTSSNIGCKAGEQTIVMGANCKYEGQLAKAFMHALGFYRMEVRSDRNTYVTFNSPSVHPDLVTGIGAINTTYSGNLLPYNYGSVLHSSYDAYVHEGSTDFPLIPKTPNYFWTIGSGIISSYDLNLVNTFYYCNNSCTGTKPTCVNGGNLNTRTCDKCNCPLGYAGTTCNTKPSDGGQQLTATTAWQNLSITISIVGTSPENPVPYLTRTYWIAKPAGSAYVQFKYVNFTNFAQPECDPGCRKRGIEIRYNANQELTSPRMCCDSFNNVIVSSNLAITPVVAYSTMYAEFVVQYRAAGTNDSQTPPPEVYTTTPPPVTCSSCPQEIPLVSSTTQCSSLPGLLSSNYHVENTTGEGFCRRSIMCDAPNARAFVHIVNGDCRYGGNFNNTWRLNCLSNGSWITYKDGVQQLVDEIGCYMPETPAPHTCPACTSPMPLIQPGQTGDMCPDTNCNLLPSFAVNSTDGTGCRYEVACTGSGWVSSYLSDYSYCAYTNPNDAPSMIVECKDGEWQVDVSPNGYSKISNVYCRENPEISCEPCASQPLPVKNPGNTPVCTNPFPPITANTITNQTGQVDVFCQNEVRCTNPSDVLTVQYADTQGCVNTPLTYGILRCAGGAWSVNVGQGNFRPVSEMYCHAASAVTTTTTAPGPCPGSCPAITTTNTDFSEWNGCCFGYDMSLPALALVEPTITDVSNGSMCLKKFNCPAGYDYVMSIGQNEGSEKSCTIFGDLPYFPMEQTLACDEVKGYYVVSGAPAVRKYAYACMNLPPEVEANCQDITTTAAATTTTTPPPCNGNCPRITTTDTSFTQLNGCCFGYDMSAPELALFEPIITDTSNATTCSFTYSCDPQYDTFMTTTEDPVSHEPICRIFPIGIPPSPSEYKVFCNTTSNKFTAPGSTYAYSAIACLHYPTNAPQECEGGK